MSDEITEIILIKDLWHYRLQLPFVCYMLCLQEALSGAVRYLYSDYKIFVFSTALLEV